MMSEQCPARLNQFYWRPGDFGGAADTRKTARSDAETSGKPSDKVAARRSPTPQFAKGGGRLCANAGGLRLGHSYGYALHRSAMAPLRSWHKSAPPEWFHLAGYCSKFARAGGRWNSHRTVGICGLGAFSVWITGGETGMGWTILGILIVWVL